MIAEMNKEIHKISLKQQLKYLWIGVLFFLTPILLWFYILITKSIALPFERVILLWIILSIAYLPCFILHFNYYRNDKNNELELFNDIKKTCIFFLDGVPLTFMENDIIEIVNFYAYKYNRSPWNGYNYSIIRLKDEKLIRITCLTIDRKLLQDYFPEAKWTTRDQFFPTI